MLTLYPIKSISASSQASWSKINQLIAAPSNVVKIATLDNLIADGTYQVIGSETFVGYGSATLSDGNGVVDDSIACELFEPLLVNKIVLSFNNLLPDQTPISLTVTRLLGTTILDTVSFIDLVYTVPHEISIIMPPSSELCDNIIISFDTINIPYHMLKIQGIQVGYTSGDITSNIFFTYSFDVYTSIKEDSTFISSDILFAINALLDTSLAKHSDASFIYGLVPESSLVVHDSTALNIQAVFNTSTVQYQKANDIYTISADIKSTITISSVKPLKVNLSSKTIIENVYSAMRSPNRQIFCKVQVRYTMNTLDESFSINSNITTAYPSDLLTLLNGVREASYKYLFLGHAVADGSYHLMQPGSVDNPVVFNVTSNSTGYLPTPLVLTINFSTRPVNDLVICGVTILDEYPTDFTIVCYKEGVVQYNISVTNNTQATWMQTVDIQECDKIVYTITRLNKANTVLKLLELYGATVEEYEGSSLMSVDILEELEPVGNDLTLGSVSSNQLSLSIFNDNGRFNFNNTKSVIKNLLKSNREIKVWYGLKVGSEKIWSPMGVFRSGPWKSKYNSVETTTVAKDLLSSLTDMVRLPVMINATAYEWLSAIFTNAGLSHVQYKIDPSYHNLIIPYAYVDKMSHIQALKEAAAMCFCHIYCDHNNNIIVLPRNASHVNEIVDIDKSAIFDFDVDNESAVIVNRAIVKSVPYTISAAQELLKSTETHLIVPYTTETIFFNFSKGPYLRNFSASIAQMANLTVLLVAVYSWGCEYRVTNNTSTIRPFGNVTFTGDILIEAAPAYYFKQDATSITEFGAQRWEYSHKLIQTQALANYLLDKVIGNYSQPKKRVTITTRGDYTIKLGDKLLTEDLNDFTQKTLYKQVRAQHRWNGAYESTLDLTYEGG